MRRLLLWLFAPAMVSLHAAAPDGCWKLQDHGQEKAAAACFEQLTRSASAYDRAEGAWGLSDWQTANDQFREATLPPGSPAMYRVRWGTLLHERFNNAEAADLFREAIAKDAKSAAAWTGLAAVQAEDYSGDAKESIAKALLIDPKFAEAHTLAAVIALNNDNRELAGREADEALAADSEAVRAMAVHAALQLLADQSADTWFSRIAAVNPHAGAAYMQVAHHLELHYRFSDAAAYYRKATVAQPGLWAAHSALGVELMRLGVADEPQRELELAYSNGYRNPATVNSLRLLDTLSKFEVTTLPATVLKLDPKEDALMRPYLQAELDAIIATYSKKYGMTLPGPVQVEMYPNHEDFAVRTMGMPGLGALGVTFGEVVAMDSPSGRKPGDFNWGATLWHEMSHVFIITATSQRVPRWFTEGLAVHEEGAHNPEWSDRLTPDILLAIREKKLLPVLRLDRGFVTDEYPGQVLVSYFQGGTLCDFIAQTWGEASLLKMVHAYTAKETSAEAIQHALGIDADALDRRYMVFIAEKYGKRAADFNDWRAKLRVLAKAAESKDYDSVLQQAPAVVALYPEYIGDANAYGMWADAAHAKADAAAEADALSRYMHMGGQQPALLKRLAALQEAAGKPADAAGTLARVIYVYPVKDAELHAHLGELLSAAGDYKRAIEEDRAVLASAPVDTAGAHFRLARDYLAAGQRERAEETVLMALEAAPGYRPAQKLLLELKQGKGNPETHGSIH